MLGARRGAEAEPVDDVQAEVAGERGDVLAEEGAAGAPAVQQDERGVGLVARGQRVERVARREADEPSLVGGAGEKVEKRRLGGRDGRRRRGRRMRERSAHCALEG